MIAVLRELTDIFYYPALVRCQGSLSFLLQEKGSSRAYGHGSTRKSWYASFLAVQLCAEKNRLSIYAVIEKEGKGKSKNGYCFRLVHRDKTQKVKSCRFGDSQQGIHHCGNVRISMILIAYLNLGNHDCLLLSASSEQERDSWIMTLQKNIAQGPISGPEEALMSSGSMSPRGISGEMSPRTNASPRSKASVSGKLDFKKVKEHASSSKSKVMLRITIRLAP